MIRNLVEDPLQNGEYELRLKGDELLALWKAVEDQDEEQKRFVARAIDTPAMSYRLDADRLDAAQRLMLNMEITENVAGNIERRMVALTRENLDRLIERVK